MRVRPNGTWGGGPVGGVWPAWPGEFGCHSHLISRHLTELSAPISIRNRFGVCYLDRIYWPDSSEIKGQVPPPPSTSPADMKSQHMGTSLDALESEAVPRLPASIAGYYTGYSERGFSAKDNIAAFARWRLLPRCMVDVSRVDTSITLFGGLGGGHVT